MTHKPVQKKADMCIGCHGIPGYQNSFPEIHKVPMISGQSDKYIVAALTAYKKGDRKHPTMRGIAGSLTEQDMADLGAFITTRRLARRLPKRPRPPMWQPPRWLKRVLALLATAPTSASPSIRATPRWPASTPTTCTVALKAYTVEGNKVVGRNNAIMAGIAKQFSHAEMKAIAKYLASLDSELAVVPQSRFR